MSITKSADRIAERFAQLKQQKRAGLITFITAGDPDEATSQKILAGLANAGADLIELGMPFSDPMADGPAIQLAGMRAIKSGMTAAKTINLARDYRKTDSQTPIVLMGYYNPIYRYGNKKFIQDALAAGVDGLIVVDLPPEHDDELCDLCLAAGLHWIRLIAPTTDDARLTKIVNKASGFVYYVAVSGVTGTKSAAIADIKKTIARIKHRTALPVAAGFGIKNAQQVNAVAEFADAVVVGSAIIDAVAAAIKQNKRGEQLAAAAHEFVGELARGLKK